MDKIAILIPCYNEEQTIEKVVKDMRAAIPEAVIYVYDNNSTDDTAEIAKNAGAAVRKELKQGKGNVVRSMLHDVDADVYVMVDGDDTYPAEAAKEMAEIVLRDEADMILGDRLSSTYFTENKSAFHAAGNRLIRGLINRFYKTDIKDILTGYRVFSHKYAKSFPCKSNGFDLETEMTIYALKNDFRIKSIAVQYRDRPEGSKSKIHNLRDGFKILFAFCRFSLEYRQEKSA